MDFTKEIDKLWNALYDGFLVPFFEAFKDFQNQFNKDVDGLKSEKEDDSFNGNIS